MADLAKMTISEAAKGLRAGDFTSEDLTKASLEVIKSRNEELNAFITVNEEEALESARAADKTGYDKASPLAGIPCGLKDIFNTKGVKSTCASPILKDFVPPYDATCVEKLREAGMILIGKTNLDEFACGASTEHSAYGVTRNPSDLERVAGGSSGGSAAAVAADMCTYALGTDTGGSIRQPASFCGIYGMKVTYGRVSRSGVTSFASSWDTIGPMCKSVEDIATVLQVIAGKDRRDLTTPDVEVPDYSSFLGQDVKGLKIGLPKQYFDDGVDAEVKESVMAAVKKLEEKGATIKEVDLPMTKYAVAVYYVTCPAELSANLERFDGIRFGSKGEADNLVDGYFEARGAGFGEEVKRRIMIGTYVLSAGYFDAYYKKAQRVRTLIIKEFEDVFKEVDVLIGPVSPTPAFKVGELVDDPLRMYMADVLTIPASAAGLPSLACPVESKGLPIGLQVIAPQFQEGLCLKVGSAFK